MKYPLPFGRHVLLERINVGGMAEVFKAKAFGVEGFERIVAVKRILPTMVDDEEFVTMFVDEARIASHLTHQNIVQIYELGKVDGSYFISMEYVAGRDLRQILDFHKKLKRPMEIAQAAYVISRVCEALEYAHRKKDPAGKDLKIIHRDVSPQNVIISYEGEVKLCDFGIAKAVTRSSRTQVGVLKGKFAYMSPEQVRGQATDRRSDLFALGVIFYEMLTGERLFLGESDYSTLESVRSARVPAPTQFNPNIPAGLEQIMMKLLTREPKDRYQWAAEVHEDLLDYQGHEGKIYHARHLRGWMQDNYARDIEIENAKLEEFMRLKHPDSAAEVKAHTPPPAAVVVEMAQASAAPPIDPATGIPTYVAPPRGTSDPTGSRPAMEPPPRAASLRPRPSMAALVAPDASQDTHDLPREASRTESMGREQSTVPPQSERKPRGGRSLIPGLADSELGGPSPVSTLFGAPKVDADEGSGRGAQPSEDGMVRVADRQDTEQPPMSEVPVDDTFVPAGVLDGNATLMADEEPEEVEEAERTLWDMAQPSTASDANETLYDAAEVGDGGETISGEPSLKEQIRRAQSELMEELDLAGALESGETLDAGERSADQLTPFVFDPSEASVTSESPVPDTPSDLTSRDELEDRTREPSLPRGRGGPVPSAEDDKTSVSDPPPAAAKPKGRAMPEEEPIAEPDRTPVQEIHPTAVERRGPGPSSAERLNLEGASGRPAPADEGLRSQRPGGALEDRESPAPRAGSLRPVKRKANGANGSTEARVPAAALGKRRIWEISREDIARAEQPAGQTPPPEASGETPPPPPEAPAPPPPAALSAVAAPGLTRAGVSLADPRVWMLMAVAVGMLAIALLVTMLVARGTRGASLAITTQPVQGVEVRIDGQVVGKTPAEARGLGLGQHLVELSAPGYRPYSQVVDIREAKPHSMAVPLEREPGEPDPPVEPERGGGGAPAERAPACDPGRGQEGSAPADTPPPRTAAAAAEPVEAPARAAAPARPERADRARPKEVAELLISTTPAGVPLFIDGKKTGLVTPVRHPYALPPGKHVLGFEMPDGTMLNFNVELSPGPNKITKRLR